MKSKLIGLSILFSLSTLLVGCNRQQPAATYTAGQPVPTQTQSSPDVAAKVGSTSRSGQVVKLADKLYLQIAGQPLVEIDSINNIDLNAYLGKTVTITGEYSGNTLFVGAIK